MLPAQVFSTTQTFQFQRLTFPPPHTLNTSLNWIFPSSLNPNSMGQISLLHGGASSNFCRQLIKTEQVLNNPFSSIYFCI